MASLSGAVIRLFTIIYNIHINIWTDCALMRYQSLSKLSRATEWISRHRHISRHVGYTEGHPSDHCLVPGYLYLPGPEVEALHISSLTKKASRVVRGTLVQYSLSTFLDCCMIVSNFRGLMILNAKLLFDSDSDIFYCNLLYVQ